MQNALKIAEIALKHEFVCIKFRMFVHPRG